MLSKHVIPTRDLSTNFFFSTHGLHGVMEVSSKEIENYLEEEIMYGYHSLGVIKKSHLEEVTL